MDRKMGHGVDVKYSSCDAEIGCIEIGKGHHQTKEMKDGLVKMPLIIHDIFIKLATTEMTFRKVHVLGYAINGLYNML
ncbi:hypothetical protein BDC45DRAFT_515360 [Circinella umbellata]|nr:hypothetical protein BDC45DRAFT_515360 [Circinella umbellata]